MNPDPQDHRTLEEELAEQRRRSARSSDEHWKTTLARVRQVLADSDIEDEALKVGDRAPMFELPDAFGNVIRLADLLKDGPVILSFYRGQWCPYCNIELRALQRALTDVQATGSTLVAVSPNVPDISRELIEKLGLAFPVLTDHDNLVAKEFRIAFEMIPEHVELYESRGRDIRLFNGTQARELPTPATYVVDTDGVIRYAYINVDYRTRAEPSEVVAAAAALQRSDGVI